MKIRRTYGLALPDALAIPAPAQNPFRGFAGAWEDWCDINYWTPENNVKCKVCTPLPIGPCIYPDPKTVAGRAIRKLPSRTDLETLGPKPDEGEDDPPNVPIPEVGGSWFEKNKVVLLVGGGALALGLAVFAMKGRGRRMNGLSGLRRKKRRTSKRARRS